MNTPSVIVIISPGTNLNTTVYWSPSSTLVTPDLWTLVGSTTIPSVLTGEQLTVSDAIVWPSGSIPATGHYCFVGLIGTAADPAPAPADFLNWNNFTEFIRSNNNVTWRNFNVVDNAPPPGAQPPFFVPLPFMAAGAPDQARRFELEIVSRLPRHAKLLLELPREYAELLRLRLVEPSPARTKKHLAYILLNSSGVTRSRAAIFPAKARIPMRLLVAIPKGLRERPYQIYARQLFENAEVGRVTWRLTRRGGDGP